ncbi:MAG: glycosyltransferase family 4 protein [Candidatus Methylomirabilales bacterium]
MLTHMLTFATALVASVSLTPAVQKVAIRLGVVDRPGPRKVHLTPMPLLGVLAMYTGAVLAIILFNDGFALEQVVGILAGATILAIVGILDDRKLLHPQIKLMVAMPVAALILIAAGVQTSACPLASLLPGSEAPYHFCAGAFTFLWVVGITAAFNIFDHMDGLCAGIAAIASAFFLLFAALTDQGLTGTLAAATLGASLGFLRWNFNPASIFMGDGGACFLGFMVATMGLTLQFPDLPQTTNWMIPVLILGVPVFDTALIIISRSRRGLLPFASPGKDHTAHRLANLGLGQRGAVLALYGVGGLCGLLALLVSRLAVWQSNALMGVFTLGAFLAILALERAPYERQECLQEEPACPTAGRVVHDTARDGSSG